jgi:hypothetical protein
LGICANAASVPVVLFANVQQEDPATPRWFAISKRAISNPPVFKTDGALDRCGKVLDPSRGTELPVAFIRIIDESAFSKRTALSVGWAEDVEPCHFEPCHFESCHFESCRNEMRFKRNSLSCYSGFTGVSAEAFETDDLIEPTLPRKLGYGRNTGG